MCCQVNIPITRPVNAPINISEVYVHHANMLVGVPCVDPYLMCPCQSLWCIKHNAIMYGDGQGSVHMCVYGNMFNIYPHY